MFRSLILIVMTVVGSAAFAQMRQEMALGIAMESRLQMEINPDVGSLRNLGMVYAKYKVGRWAGLFEAGQERRDTSSGSLKVRNESIMTGLWGRYEFSNGDRLWSPYLAAGGGAYFDKVKTQFQSSEAQHGGTRKFAGLGAGVSSVLAQHLLLEGEGRMNFVEMVKDPVFSLIVRVGAIF